MIGFMRAIVLGLLMVLFLQTPFTHAQTAPFLSPIPNTMEDFSLATGSGMATPSARTILQEPLNKEDVTKPEEQKEKEEFLALFSKRPVREPTWTNFIAYSVQYAVRVGIPANTIMLILLLPFIATLVVFARQVIGLPSLGMLVPIALSITLLATGLTAGFILLSAILAGSAISRFILKRVRIMQSPKIALSILVVAIFVLTALTGSASIGILTVRRLSIFPVLLLILLSERVVSLFLERTVWETVRITSVTLILGILGYIFLSSAFLRQIVLLYPETVLVLIPVNFAIGRYFGVRLSEYFRFAKTINHGSK